MHCRKLGACLPAPRMLVVHDLRNSSPEEQPMPLLEGLWPLGSQRGNAKLSEHVVVQESSAREDRCPVAAVCSCDVPWLLGWL